ncbi:unnamed protein product, partial [Prorocentrum cordatum]
MGILGLLRELEGVQRDAHVREYAGRAVAVDALAWLHAGLSANALELATGVPSQNIAFCMRRARMLQSWGVEPILVFDGDPQPAKRLTDEGRRQRRAERRREGEAHLARGDLHGARKCFVQAASVSAEMVAAGHRREAASIRYVVAPYEADAQIAYLLRHGHAAAGVAEDSDLLALGCRQVLFKLSGDGQCKEVTLDSALGPRTFEEFQAACILMGCDYLPRLPRAGPKTAFRLVERAGARPEAIVREALAMGLEVPAGYLEGFRRARETMRRQEVVDPVSLLRVPLSSDAAVGELGGCGGDRGGAEGPETPRRPPSPLRKPGRRPLDDAAAAAPRASPGGAARRRAPSCGPGRAPEAATAAAPCQEEQLCAADAAPDEE